MRFTHVKHWTLAVIWARTPRVALATFLICFLSILSGAPCWADDAANKAARELARKLVPQLDLKESFHVDLRDLTSELSPAELTEARAALESELHAYGVRFADAGADVSLRVSLSENIDERLWVADFVRDEKAAAVILSFTKVSVTTISQTATPVQIQRQLVFEQSEPILDFAIIMRDGGAATKILILGTESVAIFDQLNGQWHLVKNDPVPHKSPIPRDPRGLLFVHRGNDSFFAGISGTSCDGDFRSGLSLKCDTPRSGWSFAIAPDEIFIEELVENRNFLRSIGTGPQGSSAKPGQVAPTATEFFASESWGGSDGVTIETRLDGRISLQTGPEQLLLSSSNFGSDVARTGGTCVDKPTLLMTGAMDFTNTDQLQAVQVAARRLVSVSAPVELPGPVVALHDSLSSDPVRAIVHNTKTGKYEAYEISLACSH